jgi:hypothetical protein
MNNRFFGPSTDLGLGTETAVQEVLFTGGKVSNLRIFLSAKPNSSDSYTFTVRRDPAGAAPPVSTAMTCTIIGAGTSCEDNVNSQVFSAGDAISILATEPNGPDAASMLFRLDYQP